MKNLLFLISIILIYSCDKEQCEKCEDVPCFDFILTAGEAVHDSLNYVEFNPIIEIKGRRNGTDTDYYYQDSMEIDLNFDGINDLHFRYSQEFHQPICEDTSIIDCGMPYGASYCTVEILTNLEIASTEYYGLNPDRLEFGDTIDNNLTWVNSHDKKYLFDAWGMSMSPWDLNYHNSFMGYRLLEQTDTLYGWIRMNTYAANSIEIYDYVIEK